MTDAFSATDTIAVITANRPAAARVLLDHGMHCVGCPIAPFETLADACAIYQLDVADLIAELASATEEA